MKSYLEGCGVPTTRIGQIEVPRLIMGDHPYDGSSYVSRERDAWNLRTFDRAAKVSAVLRYAVEQAGITVTQVAHERPTRNRLHLQAIWETAQETGIEIGLLGHIIVPVTLDGELAVRTKRTRATLYAHDERVSGEAFRKHIRQDPIVNRLLDGRPGSFVTSDTVPPFTTDEAARFKVDYARLERHLGFYAECNVIVADPGAEVDLLAMTGRLDLVREYVDWLRRRYTTVVVSVHHAGVTIPLLESEGIPVDGYLTPVNQLGALMNPTPESALAAIREAKKPILAIKPLAGGRYLGHKAFEYVFNQVGVAAALFGMGTLQQVSETTQAARDVLGVT
jgi:hypothetical protein